MAPGRIRHNILISGQRSSDDQRLWGQELERHVGRGEEDQCAQNGGKFWSITIVPRRHTRLVPIHAS
jgi:hypothetical protein